MRVRTMLAWTSGAALGAGTMYLLDPEHGPVRRRRARREAVEQLRTGALHAAADARRQAGQVAGAAVAGYRQARGPDPHPASNDAPGHPDAAARSI